LFVSVNIIGSSFNLLLGGIIVYLMQHIFAPVSIVTWIVMLFSVALIYNGSVILFILWLYLGKFEDKGERLSEIFNLKLSFLSSD